MVFRKPYGFLIKYFKPIHLVLTAIYIYLAFKVNSILTYYKHFISGTASKLDAMNYVNSYYVIAIVASIIICLFIYFLMRYKKKPRLLYLILIAFYLAVLFIIQVSYEGLETIYISVLESKTLLLYRDFLNIFIWFQYLSIFVVLVRGLGFDIKKFNFVQDLEDLQISISDDEEVELTFNGTENILRKAHRKFRELKYYYLENQAFINIIAVVIVAIIAISALVNVNVINKVYSEDETVSTDKFNFKIVDSYITNRDYDNQTIMSNGTSFVILRMTVSSNQSLQAFNTSNLILTIGNNDYSCTTRYASRFKDLGSTYKGENISSATTYLFVYNVPDDELDQKMKIIYASDKTIKISPVELDKISSTTNYKQGETIDLASSSLATGSFKISSSEINDTFSYSYEYELQGQTFTSDLSITSSQGTILHLVIDSSLPSSLTNYSLLSDYATLVYKIDDEQYTSVSFTDKTPGDYKDGLYLAVDKNVANATQIWFDIKIRNNEYIYTIR